MTISPAFSAFKEKYDNGTPQLVWHSAVSDLETPVSAYFKLAGQKKNAFLLDSVEGGEQLGRFSMIGLNPDVIWRAFGDGAEINRQALQDTSAFDPDPGAPLERLKALLAESEIPQAEGLPPMAAGIFGYFGYDMVRQMERLGDKPGGGVETPDALFIRPTILAVFDNVKQEIGLFTPVRPEPDITAKDAYARALDRLNATAGDLAAPLAAPEGADKSAALIDPQSNTTTQEYQSMVTRAKEYIRAGDIFQVVLSQRFSCEFEAPPFELYRALRRSNPSPFLFYLAFDDFSLVGSSPEILVRVRDGEVTIRPIAGTRPRGATPAEDKALEEELLADEKERAEHLMLLDLGRNDVGRSAAIGSVRVTDSFIIERYSHVMHIVSNVVGALSPDTHPVDAVAAGFPAGTVSGAPKIRSMEIIDELEKEARGVYGGMIGYFSADGNVDTCIALRTALIKDGVCHVQAGAGIVADSIPEMEQRECENKAAALFAAAVKAVGQDGN